METFEEMLERHKNETKELQENCEHKELSDWSDLVWAPGHHTGLEVQCCKNCDKIIHERYHCHTCNKELIDDEAIEGKHRDYYCKEHISDDEKNYPKINVDDAKVWKMIEENKKREREEDEVDDEEYEYEEDDDEETTHTLESLNKDLKECPKCGNKSVSDLLVGRGGDFGNGDGFEEIDQCILCGWIAENSLVDKEKSYRKNKDIKLVISDGDKYIEIPFTEDEMDAICTRFCYVLEEEEEVYEVNKYSYNPQKMEFIREDVIGNGMYFKILDNGNLDYDNPSITWGVMKPDWINKENQEAYNNEKCSIEECECYGEPFVHFLNHLKGPGDGIGATGCNQNKSDQNKSD